MASKCIVDCVNIKNDAVCIRPGTSYAKVHKWPTAEAEFVRSISDGGSQHRTTVVDSISCRQMYLRSYTFSRKEENEEAGTRDGGDVGDQRNERKCFGEGKKKASKKCIRTCKTTSQKAFVDRFLWKCLSCISPTKVNVNQ